MATNFWKSNPTALRVEPRGKTSPGLGANGLGRFFVLEGGRLVVLGEGAHADAPTEAKVREEASI